MDKFAKYECPVCTKPMFLSKTIFQCTNGHILCDECVPKLSTCPQCRTPLEDRVSRNLILEGILNELSYDCPFLQKGCTKNFKRNEMRDHWSSCLYGTSFTICKHVGFVEPCDFSFSADNAKTVLDHIQEEHPSWHMAPSVMSLHVPVMIGEEWTVAENKVFTVGCVMRPFSDRDSLLLVMLNHAKTKLMFSIVDLSLSFSPEDEIKVNFSIASDKAPVMSWSLAPVCGIDSWNFMRGESQDEVNAESLEKYRDGQNHILVKVQVKASGISEGAINFSSATRFSRRLRKRKHLGDDRTDRK